MSLTLALLLSLPSSEVLKPFAPSEIARAKVPGTSLVEVLALRGRGGRWLERAGRLVPPTPEGAAELEPPHTTKQAQALVDRFEPGTVVPRTRVERLVGPLPKPATGALVVERFLARTREGGGAQLVRVVFRFSSSVRATRVETVLLEVRGTVQADAPASGSPAAQPSEALARFWAAVNAL
jgi:hypothetical protein